VSRLAFRNAKLIGQLERYRYASTPAPDVKQAVEWKIAPLSDGPSKWTDMSEQQKRAVVKELHRPARRHVGIHEIYDTWQADLVDMSAYAKVNRGYIFLLTVIDIFSKFAWAVPTKTKSGSDVTAAMRSVLEQGCQPRRLHVDQGKEFYNATFKNLMEEYNIRLFSNFSNLKASICERFNRTLKTKMWKEFSFRGTYKWIDILPDLVSDYNNTKPRTIKMKPKDVTVTNADQWKHIYQSRPSVTSKPKFEVGDHVRVSKYKHAFEKGLTPNFTSESFVVAAMKLTKPITCRLKDYQGQPIQGGFYQELTSVKYPDVYLIKKVLKRRGNRLF